MRFTSTPQGKKGKRVSLFSCSSQPGLVHRSSHLCLSPRLLYNGMGGTSRLLFANKSCLRQLLLRPSLRLCFTFTLPCSSCLCLKTLFFRAKIMLLAALKSARGVSRSGRKESRIICAEFAIGGYRTVLQRSLASFEGQEGKCRICLIHCLWGRRSLLTPIHSLCLGLWSLISLFLQHWKHHGSDPKSTLEKNKLQTFSHWPPATVNFISWRCTL